MKKIPDASTLVHINQYRKDKQNLEKKIGDVDQKIPDISALVTTIVLNTKISEVENRTPANSKYVTTQQFNELTGEKQADLLNKSDFDNKLTSFNRQITSNKTKHLEV